jgi:hypothetical protein
MPCMSGEGLFLGALSGFFFTIAVIFGVLFFYVSGDCPDCQPVNLYVDWVNRAVWVANEDKEAILNFTLVDITHPNGLAGNPSQFVMEGGLQ